jgi:repressor LexA
MSPLPAGQRRVLDLIQQFTERTGRPPTGPELAERLGVTHQTAYRYLRTLEQKGYLALEQPGQRKPLQIRLLGPARLLLQTAWPRLGAIPAGPLDYLAGQEVEHLERLDDLLPDLQKGDFFLEVDGDSMEGAGLLDGMTAVVRPNRQPKAGDICAVWIDGEGGTLKRVFREGRDVRLVPDNPRHVERTLPAEQVRVQGVLVMALDVKQYGGKG